MKKILLFFILTVLVCSSTLKRLDSYTPAFQKLTPSDQVISTLGKYQFQLVQAGCKLKIFQFNDVNYTYNQIDTYNPSLPDCASLNTSKGQVLTNTGKVFANLSSNDYASSSLTIDDNGVIRLIGIKNNTSQYQLSQTQQKIIYSVPSSSQNQNYIKSVSQANLGNYQMNLSNVNSWKFNIANGQLTISKGTSFSQTFSLKNINLTRSGIYDLNNRSPPYADINNAMLFPRCDLSKSHCQVLSPYAFEFSKYWPVLRIYDQQRYLIAQYAFANSNKFNEVQICPKATFLFGSSCLTSCPSPFYQKISGIYGQCVLTCEYGAILNTETKSCGCSSKQVNSNPYNTQLIKGCQTNSTSYFYGCDCQISNSSFDRSSSLLCQPSTKCPNSTYSSSGLCMGCGPQCSKCQIDTNSIRYLSCLSCANNYQLLNGQCVPVASTCPTNCQICDGQICNKCAPFYTLLSGTCVKSCDSSLYKQIYTAQNGSMCVTLASYQGGNTGTPCSLSCATCIENGNKCTSCINEYTLFVSPLAVTCKLNGPNFVCDGSDYVYDANRQVCKAKNIQPLKMNLCLSKIGNCQICGYNQANTCVLCQNGYYLHQNTCVAKCPSGFINNLNACVQSISSCSRQDLKNKENLVNVNTDTMKNSQSYKRYINNGLEPANDPTGYSLYARENYLQQSTNNQTVQTMATTASPTCLQCTSGYGLSDDGTSCIKCPSTCKYQCYYARADSCYKPTTKCTFLNRNGDCLQSCPEGSYPFINSSNVALCQPQSIASVNDYIRMDAASYPQPDGSRIYYFILGNKILTPNANVGEVQAESSSNGRLLVDSAIAPSFTNGQYYEFKNTNQNAAVVVIDNNINQFRTPFGFTLPNSVYGVVNQQSHQQFMRDWLAFIGYVLAWIILLIHCIYIGNTILYKADNLIIFCQTIYYFSFVQLLVGNYLAQYYYGWSWMHMKFFPNYFAETIPSQYNERQAPLAYKLATLDANFIRNAGFSISIFITFLAAWFIVSIGAYLINKFCSKTQIWYPRIAKNSLIAAIQLLSMNLFFFSVTQLISGGQYDSKFSGFHNSCQAAAIFFISVICLYTIVRFFFSLNGGIYMLKRIFIATILTDSYDNDGFVALLVAVQLVFLFSRYFILQKPKMYKQKIALVVEEILYIIGYFLLFFVTLTGVNAVILSIIIFFLILALVWDLMDVYLDSRNEYFQKDWFGNGNQNNSKQNLPDTQRKMHQ